MLPRYTVMQPHGLGYLEPEQLHVHTRIKRLLIVASAVVCSLICVHSEATVQRYVATVGER